jgi:hypothetical protein
MTGNRTISLNSIVPPDEFGDEGMHFEEGILLSQLIELRVSVQETSRDKLVKYADHQRRGNSEEDVVEG